MIEEEEEEVVERDTLFEVSSSFSRKSDSNG